MNREPLRYPGMREELKDYLSELSDAELQLRRWSGRGSDISSLDFLVHFLFDDTALADDTGSFIGVILYDDEEVAAVSAVISALDSVFEKYGVARQDLEYVRAPEWTGVLSAAKAAKDLLEGTEKRLRT